MIPTTAYVKFGPDGLGEVDASFYLSEHSRIRCSVYEDRPPIFGIADRQVSVTISVPGPEHVTAQDVAASRPASGCRAGALHRRSASPSRRISQGR